MCTSYPDSVLVVGNYAFALDDSIQLGPRTVKNNRVKANAVEETKTVGKFVNLVEYSATDLDDCKFCRVGGVGGGRKDTEITLDLPLGANGIEQTSDCVLRKCVSKFQNDYEMFTHPVCLSNGLYSPLEDRLDTPGGAHRCLTLSCDDEGTLWDARSTLDDACSSKHDGLLWLRKELAKNEKRGG